MGINDQPTRPLDVEANPEGLCLRWPDLGAVVLGYRALRLGCRCASCVEEMTGRALLDPGSVPEDIHPLSVNGVGHYALQIGWSDGHSTGIYTFDYLRHLSESAPGK